MRELGADDTALADELIDSYSFKPYRHHRWLSRRQQSDVMRAEIAGIQRTPGSFALIDTERDAGLVVIGRPLAWDSAFFGVAMGRLDYILRQDTTARERLCAAVTAALDRFRAIGVEHVALKTDAADHELIAIAEATGFRLMDAIMTYISHPRKRAPRAVKAVGAIRPFTPEDTATILELTREAYAGYAGRFQLDPHLPRERSDAFYVEWARNCCSGKMADRIFVADDQDGRLIGWTSVKRVEPASSVSGAAISAGSLGACRSDSPGAYAGLICAAAVENHTQGVLTEAATQSTNFGMVRVLESVGALYARAEYTFHAWLG